MNPRVVIALLVLAVSLFGGLLVLATRSDPDPGTTSSGSTFEGALLPEGVRAPTLDLPDEEGEIVRMRELRGRPAIVTFLYSNCEDACPLQAQQIKGALDDLGKDYPALGISVDPAGDTPESARAFLSKQRMTGRMRFVLGSRRELQPVWRGYGVQPQLDDLEHTSRVVLLDERGYQRVGYPVSQLTPERLVHDLRLLDGDS